MNDKPWHHKIEIKIRFERETSLWTILAPNAIGLMLTAYDLLTWLIR